MVGIKAELEKKCSGFRKWVYCAFTCTYFIRGPIPPSPPLKDMRETFILCEYEDVERGRQRDGGEGRKDGFDRREVISL